MSPVRLLLAAFLTIGFCTDRAAADQRLTVFAASSLKEALDEVNAAYKQAKGVEIVASYAGSSALIKQIEQGAPADVFISADLESMDYGVTHNAVQETTRVDLLGNRLVLIVNADSEIGAMQINGSTDLAGLAGDGRIAIGNVAAVPGGRYAKTALEKLGLWPSVSAKLAMVDNVRLALAFVARGEAPLGIVYATDARAEPRVKSIGFFPEESHPPIVYPAALTAAAKPRAAVYLAFLQTSTARVIFEKRGFTFLPKKS